jgi:hypothetical protein
MGVDFGFTPIEIDHEKGQFIQLDNRYVEKALRALGVPGIVVGYTGDKASTYASAKEFWESGGIKHCILPLLTNMEQRDDKVLLAGDPTRFIKRDLAALQRANTKEMFDILVKAAGNRAIITGNEARSIIDLNSVEGGEMDSVLLPANMTSGTDHPSQFIDTNKPTRPAFPAKEDTRPEPDAAARVAKLEARARAIAMASAVGLVRQEVRDLTAKAPKYAKNPSGWAGWVPSYYKEHAERVAAKLELPAAVAASYCDEQAKAVLAGSVAVLADWETTVPPRLVELALADVAADAA